MHHRVRGTARHLVWRAGARRGRARDRSRAVHRRGLRRVLLRGARPGLSPLCGRRVLAAAFRARDECLPSRHARRQARRAPSRARTGQRRSRERWDEGVGAAPSGRDAQHHAPRGARDTLGWNMLAKDAVPLSARSCSMRLSVAEPADALPMLPLLSRRLARRSQQISLNKFKGNNDIRALKP